MDYLVSDRPCVIHTRLITPSSQDGQLENQLDRRRFFGRMVHLLRALLHLPILRQQQYQGRAQNPSDRTIPTWERGHKSVSQTRFHLFPIFFPP